MVYQEAKSRLSRNKIRNLGKVEKRANLQLASKAALALHVSVFVRAIKEVKEGSSGRGGSEKKTHI